MLRNPIISYSPISDLTACKDIYGHDGSVPISDMSASWPGIGFTCKYRIAVKVGKWIYLSKGNSFKVKNGWLSWLPNLYFPTIQYFK